MAFELKICAEADCANNTLLLSDVTGVYDAVANPTGWGGDHEPEDVDLITITIITPLSETPIVITIDTTADPYDYTSPFTSETLEGLGYPAGSEWIDGILDVTIQMQGSTNGVPFNYKANWRKPVLCKVSCCVAKLTAQARGGNCGCTDEYIMDAADALLAIGWAWDCGNENKAMANLRELQAICEKRCKGCGC